MSILSFLVVVVFRPRQFQWGKIRGWGLESSYPLSVRGYSQFLIKASVWNSLPSLNKIAKASLSWRSREEWSECCRPMSMQDIQLQKKNRISGMCLQIYRSQGPINPPRGNEGRHGPIAPCWQARNRSCFCCLQQPISERVHLRLSAGESWPCS